MGDDDTYLFDLSNRTWVQFVGHSSNSSGNGSSGDGSDGNGTNGVKGSAGEKTAPLTILLGSSIVASLAVLWL